MIVDLDILDEVVAWINEQCGVLLNPDADGQVYLNGWEFIEDALANIDEACGIKWCLSLNRIPRSTALLAKLRWGGL